MSQEKKEITVNDVVNVCYRYGKKQDELSKHSKNLSELQNRLADCQSELESLNEEIESKRSTIKGVQAEQKELNDFIVKFFEDMGNKKGDGKGDRQFTAPLPTVDEEKKLQ